MWSSAYTRFWWRRKSARGIDASPILLSNTDGGRDCPSAIEEWTREVLTLYDQCLFLPGEVARVMRHHLYQTRLDHGCTALSQLQQVMRVSDQANHDSVIALLLRRLDEQGLEISSPWAPVPGRLVSEILWPQLCEAWRLKEAWAGCKELDSDVRRKWGRS